MKTTTVSNLRTNIKSYIDTVISTDEPVLVNKGTDGAMIISLRTYNQLIENAASGEGRSSLLIGAALRRSSEMNDYVEMEISDL